MRWSIGGSASTVLAISNQLGLGQTEWGSIIPSCHRICLPKFISSAEHPRRGTATEPASEVEGVSFCLSWSFTALVVAPSQQNFEIEYCNSIRLERRDGMRRKWRGSVPSRLQFIHSFVFVVASTTVGCRPMHFTFTESLLISRCNTNSCSGGTMESTWPLRPNLPARPARCKY